MHNHLQFIHSLKKICKNRCFYSSP